MKILVTGAIGFIGKGICEALGRREGVQVLPFTENHDSSELAGLAAQADAVIHLAGVNRPPSPEDFDKGNRGLTEELAEALKAAGNKAKVLISSSTQAELDNAYGQSKRAAEEALEKLSQENGNPVAIFRLTNVFGKWAQPNYNSAVATFAYNIGRGEPVQVNDPDRVMKLVYIDDVVRAFMEALDEDFTGIRRPHAGPEHEITLQGIVDLFQSFRDIRTKLTLPDFSDPLVKKLYCSYISYLEGEDRAYTLDIKTDERGSLAEFIKRPEIGQVFVSRTKPGITRGNHYHLTKPEKFLVLEGEAVIRLRRIDSDEVQEHRVTGEDYKVVDMTPGWTHSIENVGQTTLITLFWAGEPFDPQNPDTFWVPVLQDKNP